MKYIISIRNPHEHFVSIEFIVNKINKEETIIQLPSWRPGRYELGNFAKNIQTWVAFDENGNSLQFQKRTKDSWCVQTKKVSELHIKYNYYAAEINAGSTYLDTSQLYINPVNCCVYLPERINEECELILQIPENYKVACGLPIALNSSNNSKTFKAIDFHELADSPLIASSSLKHEKYVCNEKLFHLWFQGECNPDWEKLKTDFIKFTDEQLNIFQHTPFIDYHFFFQILPYKMYHGVEHTTSTVIALGPGYNLMKGELHENLLGVSCHELFHSWNIKTIRPIEMFPYDYTKENYSKLGYVCEGVTTYYGDYLLFRSEVFSELQYFKTLEERMQKHFDNAGRYNLSVADSSFDTWLDGYVTGIPNRKTSIYDEGCLLAFATDIFIRKNSKNEFKLDDVMKYLYNEFAQQNIGYKDTDYKNVVEKFASSSFDNIFNSHINSPADYKILLNETLEYIGCEMQFISSAKYCEHAYGIKTIDVAGISKVTSVFPNSVADLAGIAVNDEIISINKMPVKPDNSGNNFNEWSNYFGENTILLNIISCNLIKEIELKPQPNAYYQLPRIQKKTNASKEQKNNFEKWGKNSF